MKKTLLIAAIAGLAFASCKKDYTCECTVTTAGISVVGSTTIKDTKKKAEDACTAKNTSTSVGGLSTSTTCKIK